ncbi:MAG TPA: serine hydrolase domain-containing protein [Acidimicrobiales bacterium]
MDDIGDAVAAAAEEHGFSGAVRVDRGGDTILAFARGEADRRCHVANEVGTRFAIASGTKGVTALVVVSLVADGVLDLTTPARSLLGRDLPLIDDAVTIEHLLAHRSGIGDYFDEDAIGSITEYVLPVPVHRLVTVEDYLTVLDGLPSSAPPGERFSYCNGGYVVLALLAERATGVAFAELAQSRVCEPAGMTATGFERFDEVPPDAAVGYLFSDGLRTNTLHLPVVGGGDGGLTSTLDDVHRLWRAFVDGRVVPSDWAAEMVRPRSVTASGSRRYGLGFWLDASGSGIQLEGYDAGISFRSRHEPALDITWTVVSNWSDGAWPVARCIATTISERSAGGRG